MSFNKTFYPDDLENNKSKLDDLYELQELLYNFLADFLSSASNVEQTSHLPSFLNLLSTIRFNLESINTLFPLLHDDYRFKSSINLLYRSIVGDLITLNYLRGFIDLADNEQISLGNELNIFNKEYLLGVIEGLTAENEYNMNDYRQRDEVVIDESNAIQLHKIESNLIDSEGEWKRNSVLRETTNPAIVKKLKDAGINGKAKFISEKEKIKYLKEINFENHLQLTFLFKYYSQFQHFSPNTINLVNSDLNYTLNTYKHCVNLVLGFIKDSIQLFFVKEETIIQQKFIFLVNTYNRIYSE
jgi:hypothetical protein